MKHSDATASELAYLFKLLPAFHEVENIDKIYRLLIAVATSGRHIGHDRAMLFVVDEQKGSIRGLYGVDRVADAPELPDKAGFEDMARSVFSVYENVEATDSTLKARAFSVPIAWHRSALVKAAKSAYPVLAEKHLSEFATDPFFEFFDSTRYVAVPIKFAHNVTAVVAADNHDATRDDTDAISMLYGLSQQAATVAQHHLEASNHRRKARIIWKLHQALSEANDRDKLEQALRLGMIMMTRSVGATGCIVKDLTRQKSIHIKAVQEFSLDADDSDSAITASMDRILDRVTGRGAPMTGDHKHPLLSTEAAEVVQRFFSCPLTSGDEVAGAVGIYTCHDDVSSVEHEYSADDRSFIQVCAGLIAAHLESQQRQDRINRTEDFLSELSSHLAKERERSQVGDRGVEYHGEMRTMIRELRELASSRAPYARRMPMISELAANMDKTSRAFKRQMSPRKSGYALVDLFNLVGDVVDQWREPIEERGVQLTTRIPSAGPSLLIDEHKIAAAINSILRTTLACLAKEDRLLIECSRSRDRAMICIADNGCGMPGDAMSRLFMPFESTQGNDEKRALSLAGEIIQKHAGEIMIKSSRSWKTILILSLPVAANRDRRHTDDDRRRHDDRREPVKSS